MAKQGIETAKLGLRIRAFLNGHPKGRQFTFFYDHGDRKECPDDVAEIKGFCGDRVSNVNRLTAIDFMLADNEKDGNVRLLVEVEERSVSPKKALGDILPLIFCDRCAVLCRRKQLYFQITPSTTLIVAGAMPDKGKRLDKVNGVIQPKLAQMTGFPGRLQPKNIDLVFDNDLAGPLLYIEQVVHRIVEAA